MREVARIIDGVMVSPTGQPISDLRQLTDSRAVAAPVQQQRNIKPLDAIDAFNAHLAAALKLAAEMSDADKARASNFMESARGLLTATTRLSSGEQRKFEAAMRAAARGD